MRALPVLFIGFALAVVACSSKGGGGQSTSGSQGNLAVFSVFPTSTPTAGQSVVTITGQGFVPGQTSVTIGGQPATITAVSPTTVTVLTPPGVPGSATVSVTVSGAVASLSGGIAYVGTATVVGPGPCTLTINPSASPPGPSTVAKGAARVPVLRFVVSASGGDVIVSGVDVTSQSTADPSTFVSLVELMDANQNVVASTAYLAGIHQPPGVGAPDLPPRAPLQFQYPLAAGSSMELTVLFTFAASAPGGVTISANPPQVSVSDAHNPNLWVTIVDNALASGPVITIN
jgi:hypothetical protein